MLHFHILRSISIASRVVAYKAATLASKLHSHSSASEDKAYDAAERYIDNAQTRAEGICNAAIDLYRNEVARLDALAEKHGL